MGGKQTDHVYNRLGGVLMQFFNVVIFIALAERIVRPRCLEVGVDGGCERAESRRPKVLGAVLFELAVAFVIAMLIVQRIARSWGAQLRRFVSIAAFVLFAVMLVLYLRVFGDTASSGFVDIVLLGFANFTLGIIIVQVRSCLRLLAPTLASCIVPHWCEMTRLSGAFPNDTFQDGGAVVP